MYRKWLGTENGMASRVYMGGRRLPALKQTAAKRQGAGATKNADTRRNKKRVRIRSRTSNIDDDDEMADIFSDHWLVDSPRKITTEKTMMHVPTPLSTHLGLLHEDVAYIPQTEIKKNQVAVTEFMRMMTRKLTRLARKYGMHIVKWIPACSTFDDTQVRCADHMEVLLEFAVDKLRVDSVEAGYNIICLKKNRARATDPPDPIRFGRSEDGTYLSCMLVSERVHEIIGKALKNYPVATLEPLTIADGVAPIRVKLDHITLSIIPANYHEKDECYLIARPYIYDENPSTDMLWRVSYTDKESAIMRKMDLADRGIRRKVLKMWKTLIQMEHTLEGLTSYQLKTVLLHTCDTAVDQTKRWQRNGVQECFLTVLNELSQSLRTRNLPHFFNRECNLFAYMPVRVWNNLRVRVAFLASNHGELVRILKKHNGFGL